MEITKDKEVDMNIAFSAKYMMEALKTLKCENIEIRLNSEIKPIIIKNEEDENLIQLILPIKTF
jgi:DNA polymerase-3 subunit beta